MDQSQLPDELPARPRSAFAGAATSSEPPSTEVVERGKDGRKLGGCTTNQFNKEYWTPERRAEQSRRAKELIAAGRLGGQNGFHRRKTKKFQEIAAEHAQSRADEIIQKLDAMLFGQSKDKRLQLEAIREYARFEDWAVKNSREDEKAYRGMTNDQLGAALIDTLGEALGLDLSSLVGGEVVDGTAVDIDPAAEDLMAQIAAEMEEEDEEDDVEDGG